VPVEDRVRTAARPGATASLSTVPDGAPRGRAAPRAPARTRLVAVGCLLIAWVAFVYPIFGGKVHFPTDFANTSFAAPGSKARVTSNLIDSDDFLLIYPWHAYLGRQLREGHLPLWDPTRFAGAPLAADIPVGAFYPPNWLYIFGHVTVVATIIWAATLAACLLLMYWLLGLLRLHPIAAALGAVVWTFGGFMVSWGMFDAFIAAAVWLPMALAGWELARRRRRWGVPVMGLGLALSLLGGHAQISLYVWLGTALWAGVSILADAYGAWRSASRGPLSGPSPARVVVTGGLTLAAGFAVAAGLAAVQILATAQYAGLIIRQNQTYAQASAFRMQPNELATLLIPDYRGNSLSGNYMGWIGFYVESTVFAGVLSPPLAAAAFCHRNRRAVAAAAVLTGVGVLCALGTPLYHLLYAVVPGFSTTREITRFKVLIDFGLAALAALGLDAVLKPANRAARRVALGAAVLTLGGVGLMTALRWGTTVTAGYLTPRGLREAAVLAAAIVAIAVAARIPAWSAAAALVVLVAMGVDLWFFGFGYHPFQPDVPVYPTDAEISHLEQTSGPRQRYVMSQGLAVPIDASMVYPGLYSLNGYDAFIPAYFAQLLNLVDPTMAFDALNNNVTNLQALSTEPPILDLLGVTRVVTPLGKPAPGTPVFAGDSRPYTGVTTIYSEPDAFPPAFVTPCWTQAGDAAALAELKTMTLAQLRSTAVVARSPAAALPASPASCAAGPGAAIERYRAQDVVASVPASSPGGLLVLTDEWYPGWTATVDGRRVPILRVDEALRGVAIGPGAHSVEFRYAPSWPLEGLALTVLTLAVIGLWVAAGGRRGPGGVPEDRPGRPERAPGAR
jgi:hypothetical protein